MKGGGVVSARGVQLKHSSKTAGQPTFAYRAHEEDKTSLFMGQEAGTCGQQTSHVAHLPPLVFPAGVACPCTSSTEKNTVPAMLLLLLLASSAAARAGTSVPCCPYSGNRGHSLSSFRRLRTLIDVLPVVALLLPLLLPVKPAALPLLPPACSWFAVGPCPTDRPAPNSRPKTVTSSCRS